jgi:hypothetical protein
VNTTDQIDAKPFVEQLFQALQTKSFLAAPPAPVSAPIVPAQPPAINPNPPANAPTGPSAVSAIRANVAPEAGPSGKRENGDVEMGGQGSSGPRPGGRQRCYDYHGMCSLYLERL